MKHSCRHGVLVLFFHAGNLIGDTPMHVIGSLLINISEGVLYRVLVHPDFGCKFVASEIIDRGFERLVKSVGQFLVVHL